MTKKTKEPIKGFEEFVEYQQKKRVIPHKKNLSHSGQNITFAENEVTRLQKMYDLLYFKIQRYERYNNYQQMHNLLNADNMKLKKRITSKLLPQSSYLNKNLNQILERFISIF